MILEPGNVRLRAPPQQRIENSDVETIGEETIDQIGTDKTGSACYEYPHSSCPLLCWFSVE